MYQHAVDILGYLVALPADDCLPIAGALAQARLVGMPILSWRPAWSPDGKYVAFVGSSGGKRVFEAPLESFAGAPLDVLQPTARAISATGCGEPVWSVTHTPTPQDVLLYICASASTQRLMASSPANQTSWQLSLGVDGVPGPALYNTKRHESAFQHSG